VCFSLCYRSLSQVDRKIKLKDRMIYMMQKEESIFRIVCSTANSVIDLIILFYVRCNCM